MRVARTEQEVDALRDTWRSFHFGHPDADPDVLLTVLGTRSEALRPHVIVLGPVDAPEAMLVARLEERRLPARFGYATLYAPRVRCLTVVAGGMAGEPEAASPLVSAALDALGSREADVLVFDRVPTDSPLYAAATGIPSTLSLQRPLISTRHWVTDIPDDMDEFLRSMPKKLRDDLRRYNRKLDREFGDDAQLRRFDHAEDAGELLAALEAVASKSYQRGLGAGFHPDTEGALIELGLRRGTLRAWVLSIAGTPCAFEYGTLHGDTFIVSAKGFDPAYGSHHVGKAVQLRMFEDLCADPGVRTVDYGFGDADYKRRLATRGWDEADVFVYGRTHRALAANLGRSAITGADRLARASAGPERVAQMKRRWRAARTPSAG